MDKDERTPTDQQADHQTEPEVEAEDLEAPEEAQQHIQGGRDNPNPEVRG